MLTPRHHQHVAGHVLLPRARGTLVDDGADDAAEKVARGVDLTAARQRFPDNLTHAPHGTLKAVDLHPDVPVVLWRMTRGRSTAHATIFPGSRQTTITWYFDGVMDRAENYDSEALALARADEIRGVLLRDGWKVVE